ncbi:MAG TPA: hypothetical protein VJL60_04540, partial [Gammaproteobacteria bacterium]|nr:hypothetical protein [Gammaproteobacteria bacterium]
MSSSATVGDILPFTQTNQTEIVSIGDSICAWFTNQRRREQQRRTIHVRSCNMVEMDDGVSEISETPRLLRPRRNKRTYSEIQETHQDDDDNNKNSKQTEMKKRRYHEIRDDSLDDGSETTPVATTVDNSTSGGIIDSASVFKAIETSHFYLFDDSQSLELNAFIQTVTIHTRCNDDMIRQMLLYCAAFESYSMFRKVLAHKKIAERRDYKYSLAATETETSTRKQRIFAALAYFFHTPESIDKLLFWLL